MISYCKRFSAKPHLWLIRLIGVIVPRRLRADWRQEGEAELRYREMLIARWDRLDWRNKFDLLQRSLAAFWDALLLQPRRLEDEMFQDLGYGIRMMAKQPGLTAVAIITLALGIGANTAIFSVANGVLLKPLPYQAPDRLALIRLDWRGVVGQAGIAPAEVEDFRWQTRLFEGFEVITPNNASLTGENMEKIVGVTVTEGLIPLLGVRPFLGSGVPDQVDGGVWDVVISYDLWQRRFGGDRGIIGQNIDVNNLHPTVVGVMPQGFKMHLGPGTNI